MPKKEETYPSDYPAHVEHVAALIKRLDDKGYSNEEKAETVEEYALQIDYKLILELAAKQLMSDAISSST